MPAAQIVDTDGPVLLNVLLHQFHYDEREGSQIARFTLGLCYDVTTFLICNLDIAVRVQEDIRAMERSVFESFRREVGYAVQDLSEDSSELSLVGIGGGPDSLLEGDGHMLEDNVEAVVSGESVQGGNDVRVLKASEHVERLLGGWLWECSHMDELNRRRLPNRYPNGATKFKVVDLLVPLPWRFSCSESEGAYHCRSVRPQSRLSRLGRPLQGVLSWQTGSLIQSLPLEGPAGTAWTL